MTLIIIIAAVTVIVAAVAITATGRWADEAMDRIMSKDIDRDSIDSACAVSTRDVSTRAVSTRAVSTRERTLNILTQ